MAAHALSCRHRSSHQCAVALAFWPECLLLKGGPGLVRFRKLMKFRRLQKLRVSRFGRLPEGYKSSRVAGIQGEESSFCWTSCIFNREPQKHCFPEASLYGSGQLSDVAGGESPVLLWTTHHPCPRKQLQWTQQLAEQNLDGMLVFSWLLTLSVLNRKRSTFHTITVPDQRAPWVLSAVLWGVSLE